MKLAPFVTIDAITNFNHKFGDTLARIEEWDEWIYINNLSTRNLLTVYKEVDKTIPFNHGDGVNNLKKVLINLVDPAQCVTLSKNPPARGFYNDFQHGEGLLFTRLPRRTTKNTITPAGCRIGSAMQETMPHGVLAELPLNKIDFSDWRYWLHILNTNKFPTFEEAYNLIKNGDMISCSFNHKYMLSLTFDVPEDFDQDALQLWFLNIPCGYVSLDSRRVKIDQKLLQQEIKDILRDQTVIQWQLLP